MSDLLHSINKFIKERFNLSKDKDNEKTIIDSIRKGIIFSGVNIWILIFAIFLASIGLNVNSTAVIIGAMLISPLMGPIMGIGLGLGIFDFDLVKAAAKNLLIMVVISISASTIYFLLSPLSEARSEILSRTTPTIWDVLIALFGGLAGIIAGTSKEKGNVIPGVAIATALMPPLCTAGFGLARGDFYFFGGAFYLFCINTVFISVSTFFVVRVLKFSPASFIDKIKENKIKRIISIIIFVTIIPSIFIAYMTVQKIVFEQKAKTFVRDEINFPNAQLIKQDINYEKNKITLLLFGEKISDEKIKSIRNKATDYKLYNVQLIIHQGQYGVDKTQTGTLKTNILEKIYTENDSIIKEKDKMIQSLQSEINQYQSEKLPIEPISKELNAINENVLEFSVQNSVYYNSKNNNFDTVTTAYTKFKKRPRKEETKQIKKWLKARTKSDTLKLIIE